MKKRLFIFPTTADTENCKWYLRDDDTQLIEDSGDASLQHIADRHDDADVWMILPSEQVFLTELTLPKISLSKALKAIPFALEDQVADEISNIHFALGQYTVGQPVSIAVISKSLMTSFYQQLKDAFKERFFRVKVVTTEILLLPWESLHWSILIAGTRVLVRTDKASGGCVDRDNMDVYLKELNKTTITKPEEITLYKIDDGVETIIDLAAMPLKKQIITDPFAFLVQLAPTNIAINLLQNEFKIASFNSETLYKKMITSVLAGVLILATLGQTIEHSILKKQNARLETAISNIYLSVFPDSKVMLDPERAMKRELDKLKKSASTNEFLQLAQKIAAGMKTSPGIKLHSADFQNATLKIQVSTTDFNKLDRFVQDLSKQRLAVKKDNVTSSGNIIQATLTISAATSL